MHWNSSIFSGGLTAHYKSGYVDQDPDDKVSLDTTFDIFGTVAATSKLTLTAGLRNMFDRDPPLSYQTAAFQAGYDSCFADAVGRNFYLRGNYAFQVAGSLK